MKTLACLLLLTGVATADVMKERLVGNVLVPANVDLSSTLARAKESTAEPRGVLQAMAIVKDHGDVIEVSTAEATDCVGGFKPPYQLRVFVRRDQLQLRLKAPITKSFSDGTAIAIDRGAPIDLTPKGPVWEESTFNATKVLPADDQITYAVPAFKKAVELPPLAGEPLVCDHGAPQTKAEWKASRQREREAEYAREAEKRRAEEEARRAERERERAEREAKRKAAPKSNKKKTQEEALADLLADQERGVDILSSLGDRSPGGDLAGYDDHYAPYCGVADPASYAIGTPATKAAPPTVNGIAIPWPSSSSWGRQNEHVVKSGSAYVGDVGYTCGRVRMIVDHAGVRNVGGGASLGGGGKVKVWIPAPGPVMWPDGSPAGKYTGSKRYETVVEKGNLICVNVRGIAELVCHRKATTKTEMSYRDWGD